MNTDSKDNKRVFLVFLGSLILSLYVLMIGSEVNKNVIHQRMVTYAHMGARVSDGAENLVVMDGISGRVGYSNVKLKYLKDGYISIRGINREKNVQWKRVAAFDLEPGTYTLTGLKDSSQDIVALRLKLKNAEGEITNYWQFDDDVQFVVSDFCEAILSFRVNQNSEVDTVARPAVYKDE